MKVEKAYYKSVRERYKEPIHIMHVLYNSYCDPSMQITSINQFQGILATWLARKNMTLMFGCLTTLKFLDSKFAQ